MLSYPLEGAPELIAFCNKPKDFESNFRHIKTFSHFTLYLKHTSEIEGYCVLILNRHVTYLHDLTAEEFAELSGLLKTMSKTLTHVFKAKLINVACLGNVVDHLHWHFIPRTESDPKWGGPIWAGAPLKTVHREDRLTAETVRLILNQLVSN